MIVGDTQLLDTLITTRLPARVEMCACGHPKQWHRSLGFCTVALDIDEECPCRTYSAAMTLIIGFYDLVGL